MISRKLTRVKKTNNHIKNNILFLAPLVVAILLSIVSWQIQMFFERNEKEQYKASLTAILDITQQAVHSWSDEHKSTVQIWANTPEIRSYTNQLLAVKDKREFISSPVQGQIRSLLAPVLKEHHYKGFFIIGSDNISLSSAHDENVGIENLLVSQAGFLARLWAGETGISIPRYSDVPLADNRGRLLERAAMMFVGAPIRDDMGEVIALLTFRIDPNEDFTAIFQRGRIGETGEIYAVDKNAVLISDSRFDNQLVAIGLLHEGEKGILNAVMRDPGANLLVGERPMFKPEQQPLTFMAQRLAAGLSGENLDGYRDYRGVPVIGVWRWDEALGLGMAAEVDMQESYAELFVTRYLILSFALLAIILMFGVVFVYHVKNRRIINNETLYRTVLEEIVDGIVSLDEFGIMESVNPAMERIFGYQAEEMIGKSINMLMPEQYRAQHAQLVESHRKNGDSIDIFDRSREIEGLRSNGETFPVDITVSKISVDRKRFYNCVIRDFSKRKQSEIALKESESRFRGLFENIPVAIWEEDFSLVKTYIDHIKQRTTADPQRYFRENEQAIPECAALVKIINVNQAAIAMHDARQKEELVRSLAKTFSKRSYRAFKNELVAVWQGLNKIEFEGEVMTMAGDIRQVSVTWSVPPGYEERLERVLVSVIDITGRKLAEQALERARKEIAENREKLIHLSRRQVLGEMVTNIAHELNQPLTAIEMYAGAAMVENKKDPIDNDKMESILEKINSQSKRASDVIERIRSMVRRHDMAVTQVDFNKLLNDVANLVEVNLGMGGCRLELDLPRHVCHVNCDPILLQQVMVNLILNAVDSMSSNDMSEDKVITVNTRSDDGSCLNIEVIDRGAGVDPESEKNLFTPFYTTKKIGMGVGLSISKNIVESYGGELWYTPNPEGGAVFHVSLPCQIKGAQS